jgi:hypothetical protein
MARHMVRWVVFAFAVATALSVPCSAEIVGFRMVGIGSPDDSLEIEDPIDPNDPNGGPNPCGWKSTYTTTTEFRRWPPEMIPVQIRRDVNLLCSLTFEATDLELTSTEIDSLLYTFDFRHENIHDLPLKDLELVFDYLSFTDAYSDSGATGSFEVFGVCGDSGIVVAERNHVDIYLVKWGTNIPTYSSCNSSNVKQERGDFTAGTYPAVFTSYLEDPPYDTTSVSEWSQNSIQLTDGRGKCLDDAQWPLHASGGASHEFGHLVWRSNTAIHGRAGVEYSEFNELFACSGAWLSSPDRGTIGGDTPYGQSLLRMHGEDCNNIDESPSGCPPWAGWDDCRTRYTNWSLFAAYLVQRLDTADEDYTDDIMYAWTRAASDTGGLMNDMCGLAQVLGDSARYASLGGEDGAERLGIVFNDFAVGLRAIPEGRHPLGLEQSVQLLGARGSAAVRR